MKVTMSLSSGDGGYWSVTPTEDTLTGMSVFTELVDNPVAADKLHVTLAYDNRNPHNPIEVLSGKEFVGLVVGAELLGPNGDVLALVMDSPDLTAEHERIHASGQVKYDYDPYLPHVTLSYESSEAELDWVKRKIASYAKAQRTLTFSNQKRKMIEAS